MKLKLEGMMGLLVSCSLLGAFACAPEIINEVGELPVGSGGADDSEPGPGKGGGPGNAGALGQPEFPEGGSPQVLPEGGQPQILPEGGRPQEFPAGGQGGGDDGVAGAPPDDPCAPGQNLLKNGSFDELTNGFPTGWTRYGNPKTLVTLDATNGSDGSNSIKLAMPASWEYWVEQRVSSPCIVPGELLRYSGYYRASAANADIEPGVFIGDPEVPLPVPAVANEWVPFSIDIEAPAKAFRVLVWSIGSYSSQPVTLWYDDVSLVRVPTP